MKKKQIIILAALLAAAVALACSLRGRLPHLTVLLRSSTEKRHGSSRPSRGDIFDRNGCLLVGTGTFYDIHLDCMVIKDPDEWERKTAVLAQGLARLLPGRSDAEWLCRLQEGRATGDRRLSIARGVTSKKKDSLARLPFFDVNRNRGGGIFEAKESRFYPYGELAWRTLGYVVENEDPLIGLERRYNAALQDSDLHTTLDVCLQAAADSALRSVLSSDDALIRACLILMDVPSGAIRAIANLERSDRHGDSFRETFNNAIGVLYRPGEVMKPMELSALLSEKDISSLCLPEIPDFDLYGLMPARINDNELELVPLDILSFYNTIANHGKRVQPYLVDSITFRGKTTMRHEVKILEDRSLSLSVADTLSRILCGGQRDSIAGTSGVSPQSSSNFHSAATFAGFFPSDAPMYSVVCVVFSAPPGPVLGKDAPRLAVTKLLDSPCMHKRITDSSVRDKMP